MTTREQAILATLIAYKVLMIGIGVASSRKTKDGADFFLGGRELGPFVAALSASASSSSVWTLLGVSGAAYAWGVGAFWLFPACVGGFVLNWYVLGPRLRRLSCKEGSLTVSEVLAGPSGTPHRRTVGRLCSAIIVLSLATYVATQFQGAGKTFNEVFGLSFVSSVLIGAVIVVFYTMMGGFWAVSLTDSIQGLLMLLTSVALPLMALNQVGGPGEMWAGIQAVEQTGFASWTKGMAAPAAIGFVLGTLGIGLGYPGQPHVVTRFMALRDEESVRQGRLIAIGWGVAVYAGMLTVGWCGRILFPLLDDPELVFITTTKELFPPVVAGVMIAAVISAIMSTADSQLLVLVSSLTHDLDLDNPDKGGLVARSRVVILVVSSASVLAAIFGPPQIFGFVLFAWSAMGAAFGPLLLVTVLKGRVSPQATIAALSSGFILSVLAYSIPLTKGGLAERLFPWLLAFALAWQGAQAKAGSDPT